MFLVNDYDCSVDCLRLSRFFLSTVKVRLSSLSFFAGRSIVLAFALLARVFFGGVILGVDSLLSEQSVVALVQGDGLRDHSRRELGGTGLTRGYEVCSVALGGNRELLQGTACNASFLLAFRDSSGATVHA